MSNRAPPDKKGFYIKLPDDFQLPLYSNQYGYCVRDESLSERVKKALLDDFTSESIVTKPIRPRERTAWRGLRPWWVTLRCYVAVVLSHLAAFSLGSFLRARGE